MIAGAVVADDHVPQKVETPAGRACFHLHKRAQPRAAAPLVNQIKPDQAAKFFATTSQFTTFQKAAM
jgi:hypothetical protein